ncbi:MAG: hypothetical protein JWQ30_629 [Sediminibacterium sp.]|nr:hypothetical protein [Sediminibacterium sp.]
MKNFRSKLCLFLILPVCCLSQTSTLQDKSGESSITVLGNKTLVLNSGDASFSAGVAFANAIGGKESLWGIDLKLKSNEGVSKLFEGFNFKPKYALSFFVGGYLTSHRPGVTHFFYGSAGINQSNFKLYTDTLSATLVKTDFLGGFIKGGYNRTASWGTSSTVLGASIEYGKYDNLTDLDDVDQYHTTTVGRNVVLSDKASGFKGAYMKGGMMKVKFDFMVYPTFLGGTVGVGSFYRGGIGSSFARQNIGIGLFAGNAKAPGNIIGGFVFQVNDVFNQLQKEADFVKRTGISFVAGYNF